MSEFYPDFAEQSFFLLKSQKSEEIDRERILLRVSQLREKIQSLNITDNISNAISDDELRDICLTWCMIAIYKVQNKCMKILMKLEILKLIMK